MNKEKRLQDIIKTLKSSRSAVLGATLADTFHVSRQIIVQDIALLKASDYNILSTNKGYILVDPIGKQRIFKVYHNNEEIADELYTIVDLGGQVIDVFVNHHIYGEIRAFLSIVTRNDVDCFVAKMVEGKISPLKLLTDNYHFHTVEASSVKGLDLIEEKLKEKNT